MKKKANPGKAGVHGMMAFTEPASTDTNETRRFLEEAFDWRFDSVQMTIGEYLTSRSSAGTTVGIRHAQQAEIPVSTNYVRVENLDQAEKKIRRLGGQVVLSRTDIPGMGSFFWFKIPSGPVMACWQDAEKPIKQKT